MRQMTLQIDGMSCQHCVRAVDNALRGIPGVALDKVEVGRADLRFDESQVTVDALLDAVADAGYSASPGGQS